MMEEISKEVGGQNSRAKRPVRYFVRDLPPACLLTMRTKCVCIGCDVMKKTDLLDMVTNGFSLSSFCCSIPALTRIMTGLEVVTMRVSHRFQRQTPVFY